MSLILVCALALAAGAQPLAPAIRDTLAADAAIRGVVVDGRTAAPIAQAQVLLVELARALLTDRQGHFEFANVPTGRYTLTVSMVGYAFARREITVADTAIDIRVPLTEGTGAYQETVTVTAEASAPPAIGVASQMRLGSAALQDLRGVTTDDPLRAVQAMPGVATGDDFQAEFSVRGAPFRHLGIVIDGTPTGVLMHSVRAEENTGSVAMINSDVLDSAALLAGPHPRRHGDWLGATLELEMREGSRDRVSVRGAASGTSVSGVVEGPLGRQRRGSWLVSLRKSYLDWLIRKLEPGIDSTIGFWDGQLKAVYDVTDRQQLQLTVIGGDASYRRERASLANGLMHAVSGSTVASLAWRTLRERAVFTQRVSFVGGDFDNRGLIGQQLARGYTQSLIVRSDVSTPLADGWTIDGGLRGEWTRVNQILREFAAVPGGGVRVRQTQDESARWNVASAWAHVTRQTDTGGVTAGLRVSHRSGDAGVTATPWVGVERQIGARWTARGAFGLAAQYRDPLLLTLDRREDAERARLADVSIEHRITPTMRWQVTLFGRQEFDVLRRVDEDRLDPTDGARVLAGPFPAYRASLDGRAYGVDVVLQRRAVSGLTGWIGYTWARLRYDDTVTGETFDGDFDQRHTLNVFAQQRLSFRLAVSAKLRVGSNTPIVGFFRREGDELWLDAARNRVRLPRYARLDLRGTRTFTFDRRRLTLFVELMNVLGRENLGQADGSIRANLQAVGYLERLIPFVPSAGMLIEF